VLGDYLLGLLAGWLSVGWLYDYRTRGELKGLRLFDIGE
jgi:hypothetical protein